MPYYVISKLFEPDSKWKVENRHLQKVITAVKMLLHLIEFLGLFLCYIAVITFLFQLLRRIHIGALWQCLLGLGIAVWYAWRAVARFRIRYIDLDAIMLVVASLLSMLTIFLT